MMDILKKITDLRRSRNWSEYQLAERSGLTQSTISSWYHKNMIPSIPSLERICDAFDMTLAQFFMEEDSETVSLDPKQIELIHAANKLSPEQFHAMIEFLELLH